MARPVQCQSQAVSGHSECCRCQSDRLLQCKAVLAGVYDIYLRQLHGVLNVAT